MRHKLFHEFAHRYDLHTPISHYQHDQRFVLEETKRYPKPRLLDVGCGTGALLRKARAEGVDAFGVDSSPEMIAECERHLGPGLTRVLAMEYLDDVEAYHVVSCLSWSLNYLSNQTDLEDVLRRFHAALHPGGTLVLQPAHAENATGALNSDREHGPQGQPDDVLFLYRFVGESAANATLTAEYVYACFSEGELLYERHVLNVADVRVVARIASLVGFTNVTLYESWRRDPFNGSPIPFLIARKPL